MSRRIAHSAVSRLGFGGLLVVLSVLSTGCVCSFQRDWREAQQTSVPTDNLAGLWEGTWESGSNGHTGTLRAIITPCGNGQYEARYYGTFMGCVPFAYDSIHTASHQDGVTTFSGQQDLGCLAGGIYHTTGWANGQTFFANFQSEQDHGVFRMSRVGAAASCTSCTGMEPCGLVPTVPPVPAE